MDEQARVIHRRKIPARRAQYAKLPSDMSPELGACLGQMGISRLYSHQAQMFEAVRSGEDVVIITSTASGKTLSFLLPVLESLLEDPSGRAVFLYPTKALAADQLRALKPFLSCFQGRIEAGVYDGDTPAQERSRIRRCANLILTNADMLNTSFLPNHSSYGFDFIFSHLKFVVIDELHSYRGAFGSHLANLFRRLERICRYYQARPQFLCSSATIANPAQLASLICGRPFRVIDQDGSPAPEKEFIFLQPPPLSPASNGGRENPGLRMSAAGTAACLIPGLVREGRHFIAFAGSRRNVEVILREARDRMETVDMARRIAGYRSGYTPAERRQIERKMADGELSGLVSTNALELGIDIGALDTTVLAGYPGTCASFWQQTGRAGRRNGTASCVNYLILKSHPFDQYIAACPEWLFSGKSENAVVDRDNLLIQLAHIRAAAAELPLTLDDMALFPDLGEVIPVLLSQEELESLGGKFIWSGPAFPAGDYSLRNMDQVRFRLLEKDSGRQITEMDETQAYHEIYPGAVYLHEGVQYQVVSLEVEGRVALAGLSEGNYYTVPMGQTATRILRVQKEEEYARTHIRFGDIHVDERVELYKKLEFHSRQNLGYERLEQPLEKGYDTESVWLLMPREVVRAYQSLLRRDRNGNVTGGNCFEGMAYALKNAAMMVTMASGEDVNAVVSDNVLIPDSNPDREVYLFIYDKYVGGLGYSEKISDFVPRILKQAAALVQGCCCRDGCPACVGDFTLDKEMVLWGLQSLMEERELPQGRSFPQGDFLPPCCGQTRSGLPMGEDEPPSRPGIPFRELPDRWQELCREAEQGRMAGAGFLKEAEAVETKGPDLILTVRTGFTAGWGMQEQNQRMLRRILLRLAVCPADFQLLIRESGEDGEETREKLRRRYEDVVRKK